MSYFKTQRRSWKEKDPERENAEYLSRQQAGVVKDKASSDKEFTRYTYKERHGLSMTCKECGWTFNCGGISTKTHRDDIEREQKNVHASVHKPEKGKKRGTKAHLVQSNNALEITKTSHPAEIPHLSTVQVNRQTTISTGWADVTGASISGASFTAGQKYLVLITAQIDTQSDVATTVFCRTVHGSSSFLDSESATEMNTAGTRYNYFYWTVRSWTSGEILKVQFATSNSSISVGADNVCLSAIKLTPDLTENTHFKYQEKIDIFPKENLLIDIDSFENASITFTPSVINRKWLILSKARFVTFGGTDTTVQSRISRSGEATSNIPIMQQECENEINDKMLLCGARVDTLSPSTATSNTFKEISMLKNNRSLPDTGAIEAQKVDSGIFAIDLGKFKTVVSGQEEFQESPNSSTTAFAEKVHETATSYTYYGDSLFFTFVTMNSGNENYTCKLIRTITSATPGSGSTDADYPDTQREDSYNYGQWNSLDRLPMCWSTIETYPSGTLPITFYTRLWGNLSATDGANRGTWHRLHLIWRMELAGAALKQVPTAQTEGITETVIKNLHATDLKKVYTDTSIGITESSISKIFRTIVKVAPTDSIGITESLIQPLLSQTTPSLIPENFVLRLSGGDTNTDPNASLGGVMSTVETLEAGTVDYQPGDYVATDYATGTGAAYINTGRVIDKLFDDVQNVEARTGDLADYRCIYVHNTHAFSAQVDYTMLGPKIWIQQNTPAEDEVQIGLGSAAVNATEQGPLTDENEAPTGVSFIIANSESAALSLPDIPPGQKKAIWFKRIVPPGTPSPYLGNNYILMAKFYTNQL